MSPKRPGQRFAEGLNAEGNLLGYSSILIFEESKRDVDLTRSDTKILTGKKNRDDDNDDPRHNHGEKKRPPIKNHSVKPLCESTKEKKKTEFNGKNRDTCKNQIGDIRFVISKHSR